MHSKLRNSLKEERVSKLVYVKCNAKAFGGKSGVVVDFDEDDELIAYANESGVSNSSSFSSSSSSSFRP